MLPITNRRVIGVAPPNSARVQPAVQLPPQSDRPDVADEVASTSPLSIPSSIGRMENLVFELPVSPECTHFNFGFVCYHWPDIPGPERDSLHEVIWGGMDKSPVVFFVLSECFKDLEASDVQLFGGVQKSAKTKDWHRSRRWAQSSDQESGVSRYHSWVNVRSLLENEDELILAYGSKAGRKSVQQVDCEEARGAHDPGTSTRQPKVHSLAFGDRVPATSRSSAARDDDEEEKYGDVDEVMMLSDDDDDDDDGDGDDGAGHGSHEAYGCYGLLRGYRAEQSQLQEYDHYVRLYGVVEAMEDRGPPHEAVTKGESKRLSKGVHRLLRPPAAKKAISRCAVRNFNSSLPARKGTVIDTWALRTEVALPPPLHEETQRRGMQFLERMHARDIAEPTVPMDRNIANLVNNTDTSAMSVIQYAVGILKVRFCALLQFSVLVFCIDSPYPYSAEASL
ncbi:hypothetical protein AK812_SmicGene4058 [Symbiodinium microadriaticum]|uniref:Uncharacterized protein n=1 Tax=Symbiodinium microadriaticum TaxID=2951 RepID=A0A1Q9EXH6_SYMMI|nr:hypothetical protein AK812_SmicGene4058 [Symbiodinium microadriaticum]